MTTASSNVATTYDANASATDLVNIGEATLSNVINPTGVHSAFQPTNHSDGASSTTTADTVG